MADISQTIILKCIFLNGIFFILNKIPLKFVPNGPVDKKAVLD